jgi:uncharacterized protein YpbB
MTRNQRKQSFDSKSLPQPSYSDLRGRQSVRATFKLTEKAIDAIRVLSLHLGIKQKSLFDHLVDDTEALRLIAQEIPNDRSSLTNRTQKTYVVSRKTLTCLDETSKRFKTPRDALVEYSLRRLLPVIAKARKRHDKRKEFLEQLAVYLKQGEKLLENSKDSLGRDDPVFARFEAAMSGLLNAHAQIQNFVERGRKIEKF